MYVIPTVGSDCNAHDCLVSLYVNYKVFGSIIDLSNVLRQNLAAFSIIYSSIYKNFTHFNGVTKHRLALLKG